MNAYSATHEEQLFLLDCIELLAAVFRGPDARTCAGMVVEGIPQLVSTAPPDAQHLIAALENLQACLPGADVDPAAGERFCRELEPEYVRLFISAGGGVPAPLYESCHISRDRSVMGESALCMRDRLQEAGLAVDGPSNEPPDHLCIELEYLYYLLTRAWGREDGELLAEAVQFAQGVMLPWVRTFAAAVAKAGAGGFFQVSAELLVELLETVAPED